MEIFAVSAPGLEALTRLELRRLDLLPAAASDSVGSDRSASEWGGGVAFAGDLQALYRANLHLRTASRLLVRLGRFGAVHFTELRRQASRLGWEAFLQPGRPAALHVTCRKSRLYHSDAVAERVAAAIGDRLGRTTPLRPAGGEDEVSLAQLVIVRLVNDVCTISVDASGDLLHRRGYRLASAKAPLRETLAAGLLLASGWDGSAPLLDPFCGSGTIPIEAALMAAQLPPGRSRRFAFMDWPGFDIHLWQALLDEVHSLTLRDLPPIQASDRDAGAVRMAQANAQRAGVAGAIEFSQRAVSAIDPPPGHGWLVTNPPYGLRLGAGHDLRNLYAQLGNVLRVHCRGWRVAILCNDPRLLGQIGMRLDTSLSFVNGGVAVKAARGVVGDG